MARATQSQSSRRKKPSMYDVAQAAGVSQTAVSLVVTDVPSANIPQATRDRIWAAVHDLGWRPNALAVGLSRRRSQTLGLITDEIATSAHGGKIIQGIQDAAWAHGKMLLLSNTNAKPDLERAALSMMLERQVEAGFYPPTYPPPVIPPAQLSPLPPGLVECY